MNTLLRDFWDRLVLAAALAAVLCSAGWSWRQREGIRRWQTETVAAPFQGAAYQSAAVQATGTLVAAWPKARPQSQGPGWLYEVFTPPVIYYNATARSFAVTPPQYPAEVPASVFGLELLAVKREAYRLQLVGYCGSPGDYLAAFVSPNLAETLLAREGRRFEPLGLTLKSLAVRKVEVGHPDRLPVYDVAALAVLLDERTGQEVILDSRERKLTDIPLAVFQAPHAKGKPRELHEGETLADDGVIYRVERIQLDPPEVVVARSVQGLPVPEIRTLRPAAQLAVKPSAPRSFGQKPVHRVASQGP